MHRHVHGFGTPWPTAGYGLRQGMAYGRLWLTAGYGLRQAMAYGRVWPTAGYGLRQGMAYNGFAAQASRAVLLVHDAD